LPRKADALTAGKEGRLIKQKRKASTKPSLHGASWGSQMSTSVSQKSGGEGEVGGEMKEGSQLLVEMRSFHLLGKEVRPLVIEGGTSSGQIKG